MTREIQSKLFICFLPIYYVYNMLIDVVFPRGGAFGLLINLCFLAIFILFSFYNLFHKKFTYVYLWITLNLLLIFFNSSDIMFSLKWFSKNLLGLLCFPLSFYLISTKKEIILFFKALTAIMLLYILNLILANVFGWGNAYAAADSGYAVQAGASIVSGSMPIVMALMMAPVILYVHPKKKIFIGIASITIVCVFLIFKRTNIASLVLGFLIFSVLYKYYMNKTKIKVRKSKISKKKIIQLSLSFILLLGLLLTVFGNTILAQLDQRSRKFDEGSLQKEGRVIEWILVTNAILGSDDSSVLLLGKEPYHSPGNYGFETDRNIHGDFSAILFYTGVVGFFLYWSMQLYIAFSILKYNKNRYLRSRQDILLFVAYLSSSVIWFVCCFSATLGYVLITAVYYMMHGMILRYFWNKHRYQVKLITLNRLNNEGVNCSKL